MGIFISKGGLKWVGEIFSLGIVPAIRFACII